MGMACISILAFWCHSIRCCTINHRSPWFMATRNRKKYKRESNFIQIPLWHRTYNVIWHVIYSNASNVKVMSEDGKTICIRNNIINRRLSGRQTLTIVDVASSTARPNWSDNGTFCFLIKLSDSTIKSLHVLHSLVLRWRGGLNAN